MQSIARRGLLAILMVSPGCIVFEGRATIATPVNRREVVEGAPGWGVGIGAFLGDDKQVGALTVGGGQPTVRGHQPDSEQHATLWVAGRYERELVEGAPDLRWYGRIAVGGPSFDAEGDTDAAGNYNQPLEFDVSLGVGMGSNRMSRSNRLGYATSVSSLSIGVAYSHQGRNPLGSASFVGLEITAMLGGELTEVTGEKDE